LDLSKAIDKANHHALFIKLMRRHIPVKQHTVNDIRKLIFMLLQLYQIGQCMVYCIWNQFWCKTRIGLVTVLFVYLDDLSKLCSPFDACYIILYANDILLISPSITNLERLLHRCEHILAW